MKDWYIREDPDPRWPIIEVSKENDYPLPARFFSRDELDQFIDELRQAADRVWPIGEGSA